MSYRGHADWRDMSDYVVHFTKLTSDTTASEAMFGILSSGEIEARNKFGCALYDRVPSDASQRSACFSEIPLDRLDRLVGRRQSKYGIGFHQDTLIANGGGRVWYVDRETPHYESIRAVLLEARVSGPEHPVWRLTPLMDWVGPNYQFEWEREWRVPGGLAFTPEDVAFLFVPEHGHQAAQRLLNGGNHSAYLCPMLDPCWRDDVMQDALAALA